MKYNFVELPPFCRVEVHLDTHYYILSLRDRKSLVYSIMPYLKVTLVRSGEHFDCYTRYLKLTPLAIGLPKKTNLVLESLGLRKRMQSVFHTVSPQTAGMVLKVKELVKVEEVAERQTIQQIRAQRRPKSGFEVTGNLLRQPESS